MFRLRSRILAWGTSVLIALPFASAAAEPSPTERIDQLVHDERYDEALRLAHAQLVEAERTGGPDSIAVADAIAAINAVHGDRGDVAIDGARQLIERELEIRATHGGRDSAEYADALVYLGRWHRQSGQTDDAQAQADSAARIFNALRPPPAGKLFAVETLLGDIAIDRGDPVAAEKHFRRCLQLLDGLTGTDVWPAYIRGSLATQLADQGRLDEARAMATESVSMALAARGEFSADYFFAQARLAQVEEASGNPAAALRVLDAALHARERVEVSNPWYLSSALSVRARLLSMTGDAAGAEAGYRDALTVNAAHPSPDPEVNTGLLSDVGAFYQSIGRVDDAARYLNDAVDRMERARGTNNPLLAMMLGNLGNVELARDQPRTALPHFERALRILEANPGYGDVQLKFAYSGRATARLWLGDPVAAEADFRRLLTSLGSAFGRAHYTRLFVLTGIAAAQWAQGRIDAAFESAAGAESVRQSLLFGAAPELSDAHARAFQAYLTPSLEWVIALAQLSGKPEHIERAWSLAARVRGRLTEIAALRLAAARAADDPMVAAVWQRWQRANETLVGALRTAADSPQPRALERLQRARGEFETADRALARALQPGLATWLPGDTRIGEIAAALPADAALVTYVRSGVVAPDRFDRTGAAPVAAHWFAFVHDRTHPAVLIDLGEEPTLEALADSWYAAVSDANSELATVTVRGIALRRAVLDPVIAASGAKHLMVVPVGSLNRVNFAALPDGDGAAFLAERGYAFEYLNTERELLDTRAVRRDPSLFAVSDPEFGGTGNAAASDGDAIATRAICAGSCKHELPALPGTRREVAALRAVWARSRGAESAFTALQGRDATESAVRGASARSSVLHFATHGVQLPERESEPGLAALALSGPRDEAAVPALDGWLTSAEIQALDLSGVDWAVLSACDSGLGATSASEGVFGLRRSFRLAGARSVIVSLWKVDDDAAVAWMSALYAARFERDASTIDAVAGAGRSVLAVRRAAGQSVHPFHWAAFVGSGGWR